MSAEESIPPAHHREPGTFWALVPVAMAIGSAAGISSLLLLTNHWPISVWILGGLLAWTLLVAWALVRFPVPAETSARKPGRAQLACFALAAAVLFGVSAARDIEYFPSAMDGESAEATHVAETFLDGWRDGHADVWLADHVRHYNLGLAPLMVPVVWWFGPGSLPAKWTNVIVWAVLVAAALTLLASRAFPRVRTPLVPWILLSVVCAGSLIASVRQYRWHLMSVVAALGICLIAVSLENGNRRRSLAAGLGLLGVGLVLYHGNLIFLPGVVVLILLHLGWPEGGVRRPATVLVTGVFCLCAIVAYLYFVADGPLGIRVRVQEEIASMPQLGDPALRAQLGDRILRLGTESMTWPLVAVVLLGFASAVSRAPRDAVMRAMLTVFCIGLSVNTLIQGTGNPSQNCWLLVPALMFAGLGVLEISDRLIAAIPSRAIANSLLAAGAVGLAVPEWNAFQDLALYRSLDSGPFPNHTGEQFALIARLVSQPSEEVAARTLYVFPGVRLAESVGGFPRQRPFTYYEETPRTSEVQFFDSADDLNVLLENFAAGRLRQTHLVVWLSFQPIRADVGPEMLQPALAGRPWRAKLVTLLESPYPKAIRSWRLDWVRPP